MTAISYIGRVQEDGTLSLPQDAQEILGLHPGDEVQVRLSSNVQEAPPQKPSEKARAALHEIVKRQEGRRYTDGSQTEQIIREGRAGGMYDDDYSR